MWELPPIMVELDVQITILVSGVPILDMEYQHHSQWSLITDNDVDIPYLDAMITDVKCIHDGIS